MRQVGDLAGRQRVDRFVTFLAAQGIEAQARDDGDDRFSVWVMDEDKVHDADEHYRAYKAAPDAPVFNAKAPPRPATAAPKVKRNQYIDVRTEIFGRGRHGAMPVTLFLIAASVVLTIATATSGGVAVTRALYFSEYMGRDFPEIMSGQVWRLVTPIFLHGGMLHLLFNMLWLYQLGGNIEINEKPWYLALFVVGTAIICNTTEYLILAGPQFLGMSGVVYALFGYVWMMSRYSPGTRYFMAQQTVVIMLVWIVICFFGIFGDVANGEHVSGLIAGVAWGFLRSGYLGTLRRRSRYRDRH